MLIGRFFAFLPRSVTAVILGSVLGGTGGGPLFAQSLFPADQPVIILYDQEGRPGKWAFTAAPKIQFVGEVLRRSAPLLEGRSDVSLRRASTGTSQSLTQDCNAHLTDFDLGAALTAGDIHRFADQLSATGYQTASAAALAQAVDDLAAAGGGRVVYFADTVSRCEEDTVWIAETAPENVKIDVIAIGKATVLQALSKLPLASGGDFHLVTGPKDLERLVGPMIDEALPPDGNSSGMQIGAWPPGDVPPLPEAEGDNSGGNLTGPLFTGPLFAGPLFVEQEADNSITGVNTGVDQCPAFDLLAQGLLDYANGTPSSDPVVLQDPVAIAFIIDASGSMAARQARRSKMVIAKEALGAAVADLDGANAIASLRAFGFDDNVEKSARASCPNTVELVPFGANQGTQIARMADRLTPYGYTPLADSLRAAGESLQSVAASRRFAVLISDGEETCGGDPVAVAASLAQSGVDVNTYVVGYDLDADQRLALQAVAAAGGTQYLNATDGSELRQVLKNLVSVVIQNTERIAPSCSNPVRGGLTPAKARPLPPGIYTVGELLEPGEFRYYRVATAEGQRGLVRGLIQSRQYVDTDTGPRESGSAPAAMTIQTLYPDGSPTRAQSARDVGIPGTAITATFVDTEGDGFVFAVGDNYRSLPPESLFQIEILPFADGAQGDAGSLPDGTDVAIIGADGFADGHFGHEDFKDV